MKVLPRWLQIVVFISPLFVWAAPAQELPRETWPIEPVKEAPAFGTFWCVQNRLPYPFDPFFGRLPVYEIGGGIYLVDDSQVDYGAAGKSGGGEMALMSSPAPPGGGGTNGGGSTNMFCSGPTNFTVASTFSTNGW